MVCNLFTLLFKPSSCNGPETELKCKIGFRTYINNICILSYTGNWCLVPFCINISSNTPHRMCLCFDYRNTLIYPIQLFAGVRWGVRELGTQLENSYTNYAVINRLPLTAMLGRVNEVSHRNFFGTRYVVLWHEISRNKRALLLRIKPDRQVADEDSMIKRGARNCYSWPTCAHNSVKWPERESDHKPLYDVQTSGAIILSFCMSVWGI